MHPEERLAELAEKCIETLRELAPWVYIVAGYGLYSAAYDQSPFLLDLKLPIARFDPAEQVLGVYWLNLFPPQHRQAWPDQPFPPAEVRSLDDHLLVRLADLPSDVDDATVQAWMTRVAPALPAEPAALSPRWWDPQPPDWYEGPQLPLTTPRPRLGRRPQRPCP